MKIWVWADVTPEGPAPSALELLTKGRELGDEVAAVALGPGAKASADALGEHGAATVFASDDEVFAKFSENWSTGPAPRCATPACSARWGSSS